MQRSKRGFTLIELLVVVAIIALLISILLPSLQCARAAARATVCGTMLQGIGRAMSIYTNENQDWIPGLNTSGVAIRALRASPWQDLRRPGLPVQSFDWLTPLMRYDSEDMGDNRAKRFQYVINRYKCPSQANVNSVIYQSPPDNADFEELNESWQALSYLMPVHFQYWGQRQAGRTLAPLAGVPAVPVRSVAAPPEWEVLVNDYVSRVDKLGLPADKVAASDATRYLTGELLIDHDVAPFPNWFGSFTFSGGWWSGDQSYGVAPGTRNWDGDTVGRGSESRGANLELSYRHGCGGGWKGGVGDRGVQDNKGSVNALFFDGHVDRMEDKASRDPKWWYPRGTVVQTPSEGLTRMESNEVVH